MNTFGGIKRELVSDYGSLRKCEYCEWYDNLFIASNKRPLRAVVKTYFISGMNLCNACVEKTGAKESEFTKDTKVTFGSCSNAKFKCPGKLSRQNCGANALTFRDLILGTCCEAAANGTQNIGECDRLKFVEKYLKMAKKKLEEAKEHAKEADELAAKALKNFEDVRHDFKDVMIDTQDYIDDNSASDRQMCEVIFDKSLKRKWPIICSLLFR
jgi:hypothetical protein